MSGDVEMQVGIVLLFGPSCQSSSKTQPAMDDEQWVRLNSSDGYTFLVKRKVLNMSPFLKDMFSTGSGVESETKTGTLDERGIIVEKLLEYLSFKCHYQTVGAREEVPAHDFIERIPPEIVLEL
ncbi:hypothetical protein FISHEDRAFT_71859 [Fistulina hepatica ATCC 64428]|uniref:Elongin-C n=1 Tax=Fistulina hepatica ATCC 64428 TaxID=1128425 RepID=A0A0D7AG36_9AGAR|nr:hypothetical protein FISHEDRAFT_71859 [Fistulina hepatica ATCC 64428]